MHTHAPKTSFKRSHKRKREKRNESQSRGERQRRTKSVAVLAFFLPTVLRVFVLSILVGGAPCFGRVLARYQCWTRHRVCLLYARSVTCASVKTPTQRLFVPLLMNVFAPPSHTAPARGATASAFFFMLSKVHSSTSFLKSFSSLIGSPRKSAILRISPAKSDFKSLKCTNNTSG